MSTTTTKANYCFLIDNKYVKYITTEPGCLAGIHRSFAPDVLRVLPDFPPDEWTEGHIAKDAATGQLFFSSILNTKLPAVESNWHPTLIDHLELKQLDQIRSNIHIVSHDSFAEVVLSKFTTFPWQIPYLESETRAYQWIKDTDIGRKFFGHVLEGGRVIGFLTEHIQGASTATVRDLEVCKQALGQLHALGIKHGDVNKYNFLVRDGRATIIDFETAEKCSDEDELRAELMSLEASFEASSIEVGFLSSARIF